MTLRAKVLSLYDAIKPWLGEHDPQQVQQALEHELRTIRPTWTDAKLICPGWYWQKPPGVAEPRLVYVDNGRIDTKLMADLGPPLNSSM